jgi:caa(3)-type oxidase subunit IV
MSNSTESYYPATTHRAPQAHIVSPLALIAVFACLLVLTVVTLALSYVDMGSIINVWLALDIAVVQAALLALYFMRLRWDSPFYGVILVAAVFFMAIFIGLTVLDTKEYHPNLAPPTGVAPRP